MTVLIVFSPFTMGTTSSTTVQTLGQIDQRAPAEGAKIWCLYVFFLPAGLPRSTKLSVLNLIRGRKSISIFAPQRRLIAPIHVKFDMADGHVCPLGRSKFHITRPQKWKISTFTNATGSTAWYLLRQRGWLAGPVAGWHMPVLCLNGQTYRKTFSTIR